MKTNNTENTIPVAGEVDCETSSGNIFADLGFDDAEQMDAKATLAQVIREQIRAKKLTQVMAAELIGTDQSKISQIFNNRISQFTYDRLLKFIEKLNCDIEIVVKPREVSTVRPQTTVAVYA